MCSADDRVVFAIALWCYEYKIVTVTNPQILMNMNYEILKKSLLQHFVSFSFMTVFHSHSEYRVLDIIFIIVDNSTHIFYITQYKAIVPFVLRNISITDFIWF